MSHRALPGAEEIGREHAVGNAETGDGAVEEGVRLLVFGRNHQRLLRVCFDIADFSGGYFFVVYVNRHSAVAGGRGDFNGQFELLAAFCFQNIPRLSVPYGEGNYFPRLHEFQRKRRRLFDNRFGLCVLGNYPRRDAFVLVVGTGDKPVGRKLYRDGKGLLAVFKYPRIRHGRSPEHRTRRDDIAENRYRTRRIGKIGNRYGRFGLARQPLVFPVPNKSALKARLLADQIPIFAKAAAAVAHGVRIFAKYYGVLFRRLDVVFRTKEFNDPVGRAIHLGENVHIFQLRVAVEVHKGANCRAGESSLRRF